jgi:hypothetical protein
MLRQMVHIVTIHSPTAPLFQFRNLIVSRQDTLDGGSGLSQGRYLHKEQHKHRINAHRHPFPNVIRTDILSVRADEDGSCLRPRGHCDRYT